MDRFLRELEAALRVHPAIIKAGLAGAIERGYDHITVAGCRYEAEMKTTRIHFDKLNVANRRYAWTIRQKGWNDTRPYDLRKIVQHVVATISGRLLVRVKQSEERAVKEAEEKVRNDRQQEGWAAGRSLTGTNLAITGSFYQNEFLLTMKHPDKSATMAAADCLADNGFMVSLRTRLLERVCPQTGSTLPEETDEEYAHYVRGQWSATPKTEEAEFTTRRMLAFWRAMTPEQRLAFVMDEVLEDLPFTSNDTRRQLLNRLIETTR